MIEAEEIPIEDRLGNIFEIAESGLTEDLSDEEVKDLVSVLPEKAGRAIENLFFYDPHLKRLSVEALFPAFNAYFKRVREAASNGKKIILTSFNHPSEIFYALDCVPMPPEVLTSFASYVLDDSEVYLDWSEEEGFLDTMCTAQRGGNAAILRGLGPKPDLSVSFAPGSCDQNSKQFEFMAHRLGIPYISVDAPTWFDERSVEYYRGEFRGLISKVEEITGNELDRDKLRETVAESERCREYYREITDLQRAHPNPVPGICNVFYHAIKYGIVGTKEGTNLAESILDCAKKRHKEGLGVKPEEKIRQFWFFTGYYFPGMDFQFKLERNGMSYVTDCLTLFHAEEPIDTTSVDSMIDSLADRSLNYPMTRQMSGPFDAPNSWLDDILFIIKKWDIDSCIFCGHLACKNAWGAVEPLVKRIREETGVPSLLLEGDAWDPRITPPSTLFENIQEFNETMGLT